MRNLNILFIMLFVALQAVSQTFTADYFVYEDKNNEAKSEVTVGKAISETYNGKIEFNYSKNRQAKILWYSPDQDTPVETLSLRVYEYEEKDSVLIIKSYAIENRNKLYNIEFDRKKNVFMLSGNNGYAIYGGSIRFMTH